MILSFNVNDEKYFIKNLYSPYLMCKVYCLIILRNYQLVCTWALIFINIDNERVEASWLASSTMYILLNILIS